MKHCRTISVARAEVDPEEQANMDFLNLTIFRVLIAAVAAAKALI